MVEIRLVTVVRRDCVVLCCVVFRMRVISFMLRV